MISDGPWYVLAMMAIGSLVNDVIARNLIGVNTYTEQWARVGRAAGQGVRARLQRRTRAAATSSAVPMTSWTNGSG